MWYFRVIETHDGRWACRRGRSVLDTHPDLGEAVEHITSVVAESRPARLFLHRLDGSVSDIGVD